ncbi:MAG: substrate-binding domain-containing protein [Campylobacteraceae bacterium]|nr:substrate-binding domain-containing protein [Campylobacteraceae bacterium]
MKKVITNGVLSLTILFSLNTNVNAKESLMMATTTSTDNTGLLDYLAPKFEKDTSINLKWIATGTGKALRMGKNCDVDILFVHAPASEKKFIKQGYGLNRKQVMYNDFILIGPKNDPAKLTGMNISLALKTIKEKEVTFFSRGDNSGTNKKEISLWKKALKNVPESQKWYMQTGQGMLSTINMSSQMGGYTMSDRGTWIKYMSQHKSDNTMKIVIEGSKDLINQYSVISINSQKCSNAKEELAKKFTLWINSSKIQGFIADFRLLGQALFIPNANN